MGFGTGGFAQQLATTPEPDSTDTETGTNAGVFAGFILHTPFLPKWGGLDFVGEFDGTGINVGLWIAGGSSWQDFENGYCSRADNFFRTPCP